MDAAAVLKDVTVVIPVGPGDAMSPRLATQLASLPSQIRVVHARAATRPTAMAAGVDRGAGEPARRVVDEAGREPARWQVIDAPCGRAAQQNAGANGAEGDWLWFLHADCVLTADTVPALAGFIDRAGTSDTPEAG